MENTLENKLSMYQKTQGFFTLNNQALSTLPVLVDLKNQFDTKVNAILSVAATAGADITGYTVDKQLKRNDLKVKTLKLSTAIVAHAAITDNFKLKEKCDETSSSLDYMRDNDFYTYSNLIIVEATPLMNELAAYGVVANDLSLATSAAADYLGVIQAPRVQINERSRSLNDINLMFEDTDKFLKEKLDEVMKIFVVTNPSIYTGYRGARSIDQTGSATAPDYTGQVNPGATMVVATIPYLQGRTFEVENTGNIPFSFSLSSSETVLEGSVLNMDAGQFSSRKSSSLNINEAANKVLIQNTNTQQSTSYKIWIVE